MAVGLDHAGLCPPCETRQSATIAPVNRRKLTVSFTRSSYENVTVSDASLVTDEVVDLGGIRTHGGDHVFGLFSKVRVEQRAG